MGHGSGDSPFAQTRAKLGKGKICRLSPFSFLFFFFFKVIKFFSLTFFLLLFESELVIYLKDMFNHKRRIR